MWGLISSAVENDDSYFWRGQVFDIPTIAFRDFEHGLDIVSARKNGIEL